ncbi:Peptidoglycan hydrolase FlgJ [Vibrio stylophorae]|uniref:Peptidoglycan hydrolase FlgJ n=1 Tax=Vibrio stylophorae TaxID=659351 RepID=A0ABN8DU69_9VIBR|nr:flagellar assembly peptidoglycan hydrolase FlgJ [Vibrio stylophorae]CAH0534128.1 Peptidoglycan hydrolase FlgJ [Vibrio stylophorae]
MQEPVDVGFFNDLSSLDRIRQASKGDDQTALKQAARQFEAIFTQMLFKSMRDANEGFRTDLFGDKNTRFYEQMRDEQLSLELSQNGSLGLADMIVAQLGGKTDKPTPQAMRNVAMDNSLRLPVDPDLARKSAEAAATRMEQQKALEQVMAKLPTRFDSPEDFVKALRPYAEKAGKMLGVDPAILIAQAALETGWGKKVIANAQRSSHNLFNIKADPRWQGERINTQTLEFYNDIPVQERAAFRAYDNYQQSFHDYVNFLQQNPRYQHALTQTESPEQFVNAIHQAGYATDPKYAEKVMGVYQRVVSI